MDKQVELRVEARKGNVSAVEYMLSKWGKSLDINSADEGWTALMAACLEGHIDVVKALLHYKAEPNLAGNSERETALHIAAVQDNAPIVALLMRHGADHELLNRRGRTPLFVAAASGCLAALDAILTSGKVVNTDARDGKDRTPLHAAARKGLVDAVESLLKAGASVNLADSKGRTALHWAASSGKDRVALKLLAFGADTRALEVTGRTPLIVAAHAGCAEVAEVLANAGCNLDHCDYDNYTALHWAAHKGFDRVVRVLLAHGANAVATTHRGQTPLRLTRDPGIRALLESVERDGYRVVGSSGPSPAASAGAPLSPAAEDQLASLSARRPNSQRRRSTTPPISDLLDGIAPRPPSSDATTAHPLRSPPKPQSPADGSGMSLFGSPQRSPAPPAVPPSQPDSAEPGSLPRRVVGSASDGVGGGAVGPPPGYSATASIMALLDSDKHPSPASPARSPLRRLHPPQAAVAPVRSSAMGTRPARAERSADSGDTSSGRDARETREDRLRRMRQGDEREREARERDERERTAREQEAFERAQRDREVAQHAPQRSVSLRRGSPGAVPPSGRRAVEEVVCSSSSDEDVEHAVAPRSPRDTLACATEAAQHPPALPGVPSVQEDSLSGNAKEETALRPTSTGNIVTTSGDLTRSKSRARSGEEAGLDADDRPPKRARLPEPPDGHSEPSFPTPMRAGSAAASAATVVPPSRSSDGLTGVLASLGLADYRGVFEREMVDEEAFLLLGEADLKELGIPMGPRKKLFAYITARARQ